MQQLEYSPTGLITSANHGTVAGDLRTGWKTKNKRAKVYSVSTNYNIDEGLVGRNLPSSNITHTIVYMVS